MLAAMKSPQSALMLQADYSYNFDYSRCGGKMGGFASD
jgi:hypothetical protein